MRYGLKGYRSVRRYDAKDMRRLASPKVAVQPQPASCLWTPMAAAMAAGFVVRALFLWRHPLFRGDALVYGELAHHMIKEQVYGLVDAGVLRSRGEGTFHYYSADYDALRKLTDYLWEDCCKTGGGKCC